MCLSNAILPMTFISVIWHAKTASVYSRIHNVLELLLQLQQTLKTMMQMPEQSPGALMKYHAM